MLLSESIISSEELLRLLSGSNPEHCLIDVRSEGEFSEGSLPFFRNIPILRNDERAQVGTCYKRDGRESAMDLGHRLVAPYRDTLIADWLAEIEKAPQQKAIVHCWRGGLRSNIAREWIAATGTDVVAVQGGYKAIRQLLVSEIGSKKNLVVLAGLTGSRKTALLNEFRESAIDLEGHARHRGSSFGLALGVTQPTQQNFENALGLAFAKLREKKSILLEDESKLVGRCFLGHDLHQQMIQAPRVVLKISVEERISNIAHDYALEPLELGYTPDEVRSHLLKAITRLKKPLGGLLFDRVRRALTQIEDDLFSEVASHHGWIELVLSSYYDKMYAYSFARNPKHTIFEGSRDACREFLGEKLQ